MNGLSAFGHCQTKQEALACAPRCKREPGHICFGARDWIEAFSFPIDAAQRAEIKRECGAP